MRSLLAAWPYLLVIYVVILIGGAILNWRLP